MICGLIMTARAETFSLVDGSTLSGDIVKSTDAGIMVHTSDNVYTNLLWTKFSQDGLKELAKNPKFKAFVEPFIEIPLSERPPKAEIKVNEVTRLEVPPKQSLLGAMLSSSVGIFTLLLIYGANIYAGYEIAVVRLRPKALVMGVSAVLPIVGPIIFLAMPMYVEPAPAEPEVAPEAATFAVAGQTPISGEAPITDSSWQKPKAGPTAQVFKRGQFTFNRRFIETKFSGYFVGKRTPATENITLVVKSTAGEYVVENITRMEANEMFVEVLSGGAPQEISVPLAGIQEIQLQPKST